MHAMFVAKQPKSMQIPILTKRPDFVAMATVYSWEYSRYAFRCQNQLLNTMKWSYDMILS